MPINLWALNKFVIYDDVQVIVRVYFYSVLYRPLNLKLEPLKSVKPDPVHLKLEPLKSVKLDPVNLKNKSQLRKEH